MCFVDCFCSLVLDAYGGGWRTLKDSEHEYDSDDDDSGNRDPQYDEDDYDGGGAEARAQRYNRFAHDDMMDSSE